MLQIKNIKKEYHTDSVVSKALNNVSLSFRDNEFVSVLGPSGSGKTTLLNIIGGLDSYDAGDLVINGVSTKEYKDRQWDTYRNYTVGFVFQSYNLIPHQTVLGNVELALTIGGYTKKESKKRAVDALKKVGLKDHINKRPNQLSGGQMQRVAIARALVNDPDILLADEPTGALDSETSVQIMNLLQEVAKDRLVVMVTHNPELAEEYSTRIIKLKDGEIIDDSNPFDIEKYEGKISELNYVKKSKMSGLTCLGLSFKNLLTKKRRTLLTAFAGSIGIIGISLILSLSTGVNQYIDDIQSDTMASYPITIDAETISMDSFIDMKEFETSNDNQENNNEGIYVDLTEMQITTSMIATNNLTEFKKYLEDESNGVEEYLGDNGIIYSYDIKYKIYTYDENDDLVDTDSDTSELIDSDDTSFSVNGNTMTAITTSSDNANFSEILKDENDLVNTSVKENYTILDGMWPTDYNEVVLFVNSNNTLDVDTLYQLGFISKDEYIEIYEKLENGEEVEDIKLEYENILEKEYYILTSNERYEENDNGNFDYLDDEYYISNSDEIKEGTLVKIVGIAKLNEDVENSLNSTAIGYTAKLTDYIINLSNESEVVKAQKETPETNVLNGMEFEAVDDDNKAADAKEYISNLGVSDKASTYMTIMYASGSYSDSSSTSSSSYGATTPDESTLAAMMDAWLENTPDNDILIAIYDSAISGSTYEENMADFGFVNYDEPTSINIYTDSFENKDNISRIIDEYNSGVDEEDKITYTDFVALLTSSLTSIIDVISYVLIAFVSVSLFVSCIMIGIITHISVMERTKEIGVLRALGASKKNISQVFNAETLLIGLCSGVIGVVATILMNIPITKIIQNLVENDMINVNLPFASMIILVVLSVIITIVGGLLPAKNAAKKDPVIALRSE